MREAKPGKTGIPKVREKAEEAGWIVTRRNLLIGAAGLVFAAAAGAGTGYYSFWPQPSTAAPRPSTGGGEVSSADLLTPGPLGDQVMGAANAPVTIIEYASMTCPHCAHFHETTYPEMKK